MAEGTRDARRSRGGKPPLVAALDLGTNNCRLLVARVTRRGELRVVDSFSRIVRLGEGVAQSGRLSDAAMARFGFALGWEAANQSRPVGWKKGDEFERARLASQ